MLGSTEVQEMKPRLGSTDANSRMLNSILLHRANLIETEERIGRRVSRMWLQGATYLESVVREFWPTALADTHIRSATRTMTLQMGLVIDSNVARVSLLTKGKMLQLAEMEHQWAVGMLYRHVPNAVWEFTGGIEGAQSATEILSVDLVKPLDPIVAGELMELPLRGSTWAERFEDLAGEQRIRLRRSVSAGIANAEGIPGISRRIRNEMEWGAKRATLVARTEVHHVSTQAQRRVFDANRKVLRGVEHVATLDERCCLECGGYDGLTFFYEPGPGEASISEAPRIPVHARCRCVQVPLTRWTEMLGITAPSPSLRASMNGPVPTTLPFKVWLRGQAASVQDKVLGKTRGAMWRKSGMAGLPRPGPLPLLVLVPAEVIGTPTKRPRRRLRKDGENRAR